MSAREKKSKKIPVKTQKWAWKKVGQKITLTPIHTTNKVNVIVVWWIVLLSWNHYVAGSIPNGGWSLITGSWTPKNRQNLVNFRQGGGVFGPPPKIPPWNIQKFKNYATKSCSPCYDDLKILQSQLKCVKNVVFRPKMTQKSTIMLK